MAKKRKKGKLTWKQHVALQKKNPLAAMKKHYRHYFKHYTPDHESWEVMKAGAARLGIKP